MNVLSKIDLKIIGLIDLIGKLHVYILHAFFTMSSSGRLQQGSRLFRDNDAIFAVEQALQLSEKATDRCPLSS